MATRFNLVGTFKRTKGLGQVTTERHVLVADMTPSECCVGQAALTGRARDRAKVHLMNQPGEKCWLHDWELEEVVKADVAA